MLRKPARAPVKSLSLSIPPAVAEVLGDAARVRSVTPHEIVRRLLAVFGDDAGLVDNVLDDRG